ncbi:MAG: flagellar basal body protein, partial [Pseudomonadota bacterium]
MNQIPDVLTLAMSAARHAASRQQVIATNVANADTPNYRAKDVLPFSPKDGTAPLRRTHAGHFAGARTGESTVVQMDGLADPNGNTVSLEEQILRGIDAQRQHNR